jgi:hypothetical protein
MIASPKSVSVEHSLVMLALHKANQCLDHLPHILVEDTTFWLHAFSQMPAQG